MPAVLGGRRPGSSGASRVMQITSAFEVPLPVDESWHVLLDVPRIASCMPGAQLTEVFGDDAYGGKVAVRLGPVGLSFKGRARIVSAAAAERRAQVDRKSTRLNSSH